MELANGVMHDGLVKIKMAGGKVTEPVSARLLASKILGLTVQI